MRIDLKNLSAAVFFVRRQILERPLLHVFVRSINNTIVYIYVFCYSESTEMSFRTVRQERKGKR